MPRDGYGGSVGRRRGRARHAPDDPARYRRGVGLAKWLLPVGALAVLASIFLSGERRGGVEDLLTVEERARLGAGLRLDNPRFAGVTEGGEPFVLSARAALPDGAMPDVIALEAPRGRLTLGDGRAIEGEAEEGLLRRAADTLTLSGAVRITTSDGYAFGSEVLTLDLESKDTVSPGPVVGTGPRGRIEAGSMTLRGAEGGATDVTVFFEGGVRVLFRPDRDD